MILGIDEVGRGPWAGPLVVGAVILGCEIDGITDSKKLSVKRRDELGVEIRTKAKAVALGWVWPDEIDTLGLGPALELACRRALEDVDTRGVAYHEIIIDGTVNLLKNTPKGAFVTTMKKADLLVPSVGAASIVAKVARDNYMKEQSRIYPEYGFSAHVGYGTAAHQEALEKHGITPLHRLSFAPLMKYKQAPPTIEEQDQRRGDISLRTTAKAIGDYAETVASKHLEGLGHVILERNWRTKFCEIDIVSQKANTIYFVEVKYRKNDRAGDGLAMITSKKLRQMQFAAKLYAANSRVKNKNLQLAAIAAKGDPPEITDYIEIF